MTTAELERPAPGAGRVEPRSRGETSIAERVVSRIVKRAVDETDDAGGLDRSVLGLPVGRGRSARVDVDIDGGSVTARVRMSVAYPEPVREVTHRVRDHVRERVERLTGLRVRQVDIDVAELERPEPQVPQQRVVS